MTEAQWQRRVIDLAERLRWRAYHAPANRPRKSGVAEKVRPGWPDLSIVRPPRIVFAELKTETGRLSTAQRETLAALEACGLETYVWRPRDWPEVVKTLGGYPQHHDRANADSPKGPEHGERSAGEQPPQDPHSPYEEARPGSRAGSS